jgi:hypothetical protein
MTNFSSEFLAEATVSALERTAMVLAELADDVDDHEPATAFARIAYSGPSKGALTLAATEGFMRELASSLLGVEPDEVEVDVQGIDALKEMANILGGSVIVAMSGESCDFSLGLPGIVTESDVPVAGDPSAQTACTVTTDDGVLRVTWTRDAATNAA